MRVYVVTANVVDRDEYRDYTLNPVDRWYPYSTTFRVSKATAWFSPATLDASLYAMSLRRFRIRP